MADTPRVLRIYLLTNHAETGRWCDECMTSGGFRIPVLSDSGMSYASGCITCRQRKDDVPTA